MTGDRVAEIREGVEQEIHSIDLGYSSPAQWVDDLAYLLAELDAANRALAAVDAADQHDRAENARLRAQLDTVRELADNAPLVPVHAGGGNLVNGQYMVPVEYLRAALNQGGDHV